MFCPARENNDAALLPANRCPVDGIARSECRCCYRSVERSACDRVLSRRRSVGRSVSLNPCGDLVFPSSFPVLPGNRTLRNSRNRERPAVSIKATGYSPRFCCKASRENVAVPRLSDLTGWLTMRLNRDSRSGTLKHICELRLYVCILKFAYYKNTNDRVAIQTRLRTI